MSVLTGDLGSQVRQTRSVSRFTRLELDGIGHVHVAQGAEESLTVEAPEQLIEWIETRVDGDTLRFSLRAGFRRHDVGKVPIRYEVGMRDVGELGICGAGSITTGPLHCGDLELEIDGTGKISIPEVAADALTLRIDGAGTIDIGRSDVPRQRINIGGAGHVVLEETHGDTLTTDVDGAGTIDASGTMCEIRVGLNGMGTLRLEELESERATIRIDGTGKVAVWANASLDVRIDGFGKLRFRGDPTVTAKTGGFGRIMRIDGGGDPQ